MTQKSLTHPKNSQRVSSSLQQASTELPSAYWGLEKCVEDFSRELSESDHAAVIGGPVSFQSEPRATR